MKPPEITIAGISLKASGSGWAVGEIATGTDEIHRMHEPLYFGTERVAWAVFLSEVRIKIETTGVPERDRRLFALLANTHHQAMLLDVPEYLYSLRQDFGLGTRRLSAITGVARSGIREIEAGRRDPQTRTLSRIHDVIKTLYNARWGV